MMIKDEVDKGIDELHSIILKNSLYTGQIDLILMNVVGDIDINKFKGYSSSNEDIVDVIRKIGYSVDEITVYRGYTDIDFSIRDISKTKENYIFNETIGIGDIYKWIRYNMRYLNIIKRNNIIFQQVKDILDNQ
jgi:hypothetical protein